MPFNANTDPELFRLAGIKSAAVRWGGKDPSTVRNLRLGLTVSQHELVALDAKAEELGISRTELLIKGALTYKG